MEKYLESMTYRPSAEFANPHYIAWMADQAHDGPSTVSGSSAWRRPAPVAERPASAPLPSVEGN